MASNLWTVTGTEEGGDSNVFATLSASTTPTPSIGTETTSSSGRRPNSLRKRSSSKSRHRRTSSATKLLAVAKEAAKHGPTKDDAAKNDEARPLGIENNPSNDNGADNPSVLLDMIKHRDWNGALRLCQESPNLAGMWSVEDNVDGSIRWRLLPVHRACELNPPRELVGALLRGYPKGAQKSDSGGALPVHLACRERASSDVIRILLDAFPKSAEIIDDEGRLPLHLACRRGTPLGVVNDLLRAFYRGAQVKDTYELLPVHWACSQNASAAVVETLLRAYPPSSRAKDKWGRTPLSLVQASSNPDKEQIVISLNREESYWTTSLLDEISALKSQLNMVFAKKQAYKERATTYAGKMEEANASFTLHEKEKEELQSKNEQLKSDLEEERRVSSLLQDERNKLAKTVGELDQKNSVMHDKALSLMVEVDDLTAENKRLEEEVRANAALRTRNADLEKRIKTLASMFSSMKEERNRISRSAQVLEDNLLRALNVSQVDRESST